MNQNSNDVENKRNTIICLQVSLDSGFETEYIFTGNIYFLGFIRQIDFSFSYFCFLISCSDKDMVKTQNNQGD